MSYIDQQFLWGQQVLLGTSDAKEIISKISSNKINSNLPFLTTHFAILIFINKTYFYYTPFTGLFFARTERIHSPLPNPLGSHPMRP
ncbi:hypothetical protein HMPREF3201_01233 [Megasphaera sp. MJR8396C]|nr:hypothetical protein HMPREF3201_01233 [Megasphaera sp. MJR8396C]